MRAYALFCNILTAIMTKRLIDNNLRFDRHETIENLTIFLKTPNIISSSQEWSQVNIHEAG